MKKTIFLMVVLLTCVLMGTYAQQYNTIGNASIEDEQRTFSQRLEEGVRPKTPSRMTFYGELYARGWIGGNNPDKTKFIQGADMSGDDSFIGILWEFTNYTGLVFEIEVYPEINGMNLYYDKAYIYSDIAGEAGSKNMIARLSVGRFDFDSAFYNPVDPMNTGDDMQHDGNTDPMNMKLEIGTKGDLYPILFMFAGDLDFGYRAPGASGVTYMNRGATGMFEVRSDGFNMGDMANMSWNVYYMGRFMPDVDGTGATSPDAVLNKTINTVGGTLGLTVSVAERQSIKVGGGFEYNNWFYGGVPANVATQTGKIIQSIDWEAGLAYVLANQFVLSAAMRQNGYSHAQYAVMNNTKPLTDMHAALAFNYLGLKEIAKISFYAGFAYGFGSMYSSELYKNAWNAANNNPMYSSNDVDGYIAPNPISVDVGMGYHPTSNGSILVGYNYGTWGMEAPDYASRNIKGSWGKFYVKGAYIW